MSQVATTVKRATKLLSQADVEIFKAEEILLQALDLSDWQPPEPLTYTRNATEVFGAQRMDSEHYAPA